MISESGGRNLRVTEPKGKRRGFGLVLRLLISAILLGLIFRQVFPGAVLERLAEADLFFVGVAFFLLALERGIGLLRWILLCRIARPGYSVNDATGVFFLSNFIGLALPVSLGGDVVRLVGTARSMGRTGEAVRAVLYERIFGLLSLLVVLAAGAFLAPAGAFGPVPQPVLFGLGAALFLLLLVPLHRGLVSGLARFLDRGCFGRGSAILADYAEVLADRRLSLWSSAFVMFLSVSVQLLKVGIVYGFGLAVGLDLEGRAYLGLVPVVNLVAQLPFSLGGLGLREGAFLVLLSGLLGGVEVAGAPSLAISALTYLGVLASSSPGLFYLLGRGRFPVSGTGLVRGIIGGVLLLGIAVTSVFSVESLRSRLPWKVREAFERVWVRGELKDKRLYFERGGIRIEIPCGDRRLRGTLHLSEARESNQKDPGLLVLHGSNDLGRGLGLYRVWAREFSSRGRVVLALDLAAFGESDDPSGFDDAEEWDGLRDLRAAVQWLSSRPEVDSDRLDVLGHSLGGGVALAGALVSPGVRKVIAVGPGRRLGELLSDPKERERSRWRFARDRTLSVAPPEELVMAVAEVHRIDRHLEELSQPFDHPPLLLVDGELEDPLDLEFLDGVYSRIAEPKAFLRLPGTAHYLNVLGVSEDDSFGVYDRAVMDRFVTEVESFLEKP